MLRHRHDLQRVSRLPLRPGLRPGLHLVALTALACLLHACGTQQANLPALGDHTVVLWNADTIDFIPGRTADTVPSASGDYRLDAGRIRLKPIALPHRDRQCAITVDVSLRSAGDPWDKSGTCLLYTSPSPRDLSTSRMPSSA